MTEEEGAYPSFSPDLPLPFRVVPRGGAEFGLEAFGEIGGIGEADPVHHLGDGVTVLAQEGGRFAAAVRVKN